MTREKVQRPIRKGIQELGIAPELPMPLIFSQRGYLNCISAPSLEAKQGKSLHQLPTHSVQGEASGTLRPQQLLRYTNTNTELSVLREQATSGEEIRGAGIILRKEAVRLCTRGFAQSPQISAANGTEEICVVSVQCRGQIAYAFFVHQLLKQCHVSLLYLYHDSILQIPFLWRP